MSNPPYYDPQKFLTPPDPAREIARTTVQLAYSELFANVKKLLLPKGRFSLIIPVAAKADVFKIAAQNGFYLSRQTLVAYNPDKEPARILLELCPFLITPMFANFTVYQPNSSLFSPQYAALCHDLYLFPQ